MQFEHATGARRWVQHYRALLVKRVVYTRRNIVLMLTQLIVPLFFLIVGAIIRITFKKINDPLPLVLDLSHFRGPEVMA